MERNRSRNRSLFKLSYQTRPSNCGDLSRPLGRLPRFFVDIYVAAVHRSLLRPNHRTICNEKLAVLRNELALIIPPCEPFESESNDQAQARASSTEEQEERTEETKKEKKKGEQRTFPFLSVAARAIEFHSNTLAAPFRSFPLPIQVTRRTSHSHTHTYTYAHVAKSRAKSRGGEETEREGEREGYGKTAPRHRDVARGVSPPTDSRRGSSSFAPSCASTRTGRAGTARRRLVASSARAHASRRARTSPLDCSPARLAAAHLPPRYFPRS